MRKEFIKILLDSSCDKNQLVKALAEMISDEDQLAWIMGMIPHMDKKFVTDHYSDLLAIAEPKFNAQKDKGAEKIVGEVRAANHPWEFPYVIFAVKKNVFVLDSAKEQCDAVSAEIEEYLASNNNPSFDELDKLMDKYPYCQKKNTADENYCSQITYYDFNTVYLYSDDISHIIEE